MVQGQAALANPIEGKSALVANGNDSHDIQQYQKIVQFRDTVLAGKHPRVRLPPGVTASSSLPGSARASTGVSYDRKYPGGAPSQLSAANGIPLSLPSAAATPAKTRLSAGNVEINPILLEKSESLIKAEIRLQRQKLERGLRDEYEQRRNYSRAKEAELTDIDLSEVLSKALTIVQATAVPLSIAEDLTATNETASDSFDDNTFYSSQDETPDSRVAAQVRNDSKDVQAHASAIPKPVSIAHAALQAATTGPIPIETAVHGRQSNAASQPSQKIHAGAKPSPAAFPVPGLNNYTHGEPVSASISNPSGHDNPANKLASLENRRQNKSRAADPPAQVDQAPSPLIRAHHDLNPVAPRPTQVSPLVVGNQLATAGTQGLDAVRRAPAQVAALRHEQSTASSPASSPRAGKRSDKQKPNKQKRKANRQAPEDVVPCIKAEPRSQSPINAPTFVRPTKRQKQSQRQPNDENPEGPSVATSGSQHQFEPRPPRGQEHPSATDSVPQRSATTVIMADRYSYAGSQQGDPRVPVYDVDAGGVRRLARMYPDDRGGQDVTYVRRHPSPRFLQRSTSVVHSGRPIVVDDGYGEIPRQYGESFEAVRSTVRPESDTYGPSALAPARIVVDAFGREYIEPSRHSVRQTVAPTLQYREQEIFYERMPLRAVSRNGAPAGYDPVHVYQPPGPDYIPQTAVNGEGYPSQLSQHRERDRQSDQHGYWVRPSVTVQGSYERAMTRPDRPVDSSRDFTPRQEASVRPAEHVRYEIPQEYTRIQTVRPEPPARDYPASGQPESHREAPQPYTMEYGMRPVEPHSVVSRGYSVRPIERYYEQPSRGDGITYVQRLPPTATQDIVYSGRFPEERSI